MSSDTQFTAQGPISVGFQTDGTNIQIGAGVDGTVVGVLGRGPLGVIGEGESVGVRGKGGTVGVVGEGGPFGVQGKGTTEGVHGEGTTEGVHGEGTTGVRGIGRDFGVKGELNEPTAGTGVYGRGSPGVYGEASGGGGGLVPGTGVRGRGQTGVRAEGIDGPGVDARSGEAQGAVLDSDVKAQLRLKPTLTIKDPTSLRTKSEAGDVLATLWRDLVPKDEQSIVTASLWFCKVGGDPTEAKWVKLA